ncbi:MAG: translation initiation factor IF-2 [Candidatus Binatia bacterium]|nr:MAG: translation initiation factor IF-2 [Candidatus Binatia bacterium]
MPAVGTKRVREFAKELGVAVKEVLDAAERVGVRGKRALSTLTEEEAHKVQQALGRSAAEAPASIAVGEERVVTSEGGETVVERRVSATVIRRRASSATGSTGDRGTSATATAPGSNDVVKGSSLPLEALSGPLLGGGAVSPLPGTPDESTFPPPIGRGDDLFGGLGELGDMIPSAPVEEIPPLVGAEEEPEGEPSAKGQSSSGAAEPAVQVGKPAEETGEGLQAGGPETVLVGEGASGVAAPLEVPAEGSEGAAANAAPTSAEAQSSAASPARRGPVVLGKIDLNQRSQQQANARQRFTRERTSSAPGRDRPVAVVLPPPMPVEDRPRKRKRRVVERGETGESFEPERQRGVVPKKRKATTSQEGQKTEITVPRPHKRVVRLTSESIAVRDLAREMAVRETEVVRALLELGITAGVNHRIDFDTATLVAEQFGFTVEQAVDNLEARLEDETATTAGEEQLQPRPPVVTIMGHVDHGKTSLLDAIRQTNVTAQEAGGITQHIGAYMVDVHGRQITFLDTPGHEAFTAMRARGAKVTDIVVLVVAADDGVMPQTVEAINHARAAGVPIIVAVNKIDKPEANVERVTRELAQYGLVPEEWGGDTIFVPVSAKTKAGLPALLEMILLQADVLELKANPQKRARGTIVEAKLDRGRGPVATVLIQEGTLHEGEPFVCGPYFGRVRALINDRGQRVKEAGPSTPVEILGFDGVPEAGSVFTVAPDEATARSIAERRQQKLREESLAKSSRVTLEDLHRRIQAGDFKELRVVLKADVQGSVEALSNALNQLSTDEVKLKILHASVGGIKESDVDLAAASNAIVIGFNVRPEAKATEEARRQGVEIRLYDVIYEVVDDVRAALQGLLAPSVREVTLGRAEVREVFKVPGFGAVAGVQVLEGKIVRGAEARLIRDSVVVYTGRIGSLRRFKEDVREVAAGYECGVGLENFQDIKQKDIIEVFHKEEVARQLPAASKAS